MTKALRTLLISSPTGQAGKSTVVHALKAYWQQYRHDQQLGTLSIPVLGTSGKQPELSFPSLWQSLVSQSQEEMVLVEGGGGLGSPVTDDTTIAALARDWRLPTVLVVPASWEVVAATVSAIALARYSQLQLLGIILNHSTPGFQDDEQDFLRLLYNLTQVGSLGSIPFLDNVSDEVGLCQAASDLMIEKILCPPKRKTLLSQISQI